MGKSIELRTKELVDSTTKFSLLDFWNNIVRDNKELGGADYKKLGDVAAAAKKYDEGQDKFREAAKKKEDAMKIYTGAKAAVENATKETEGLQKELDDIKEDERAGKDMIKDVKTVDDALNNMEEALKAQTDLNKERKEIYNNLLKAGENWAKYLKDTIDKLKKEKDAAETAMKTWNDQLNSVENKIRDMIVKYSNKATADKKPALAKEARALISAFGN